MNQVIYKSAKEILGVELHSQSGLEYSDQLYIQDGGSYKKRKIEKRKVQKFISRIKGAFKDELTGIKDSVCEISPWDDDMYIWIQFNKLDDGFTIYMD